ncbi:MAG: hypothetical protein ACR2JG_11875 [Geodermatophilaceae bacterium]
MCAAGERKLLDEFLLARALEHDAPGVLLQVACDRLRAERIVRPSVDSRTRRVASARDGSRAETYLRLSALLQPPRPRQLDGMLDVDPDLGGPGCRGRPGQSGCSRSQRRTAHCSMPTPGQRRCPPFGSARPGADGEV